MASVPNRLLTDSSTETNLALANDNFDKAVQDISDLGAQFTTIAYIIDIHAANTITNHFVSINDEKAQYRNGYLPCNPRFDIWVDVDNNANNLWNNPANTLTSAQKSMRVYASVVRTTYAVLPTSIATYYITIENLDVSSHTYYIRTDAWYLQSPTTGQFR